MLRMVWFGKVEDTTDCLACDAPEGFEVQGVLLVCRACGADVTREAR